MNLCYETLNNTSGQDGRHAAYFYTSNNSETDPEYDFNATVVDAAQCLVQIILKACNRL